MVGREPRYHGRMATNEPPSPSSPAAAASPSAPPAPPVPRAFSPDEGFARRLDELDPLRGLRDEFFIPTIKALHAADHAQSAHAAGGHAASHPASRPDGRSPMTDGHGPCVYLTGNSLGCQPKGVRAAVDDELADWARLGVEGHVHGKHPWLHYHEMFREPLARIVGAKPGEVVAMNTLTVNLHLMMISFYRPTPKRYKILIEDSAFPSDSYAVISQAAFHRFNPSMTVLRMVPRDGEHTLRTEDVLAIIEREGPEIVLVLLGGVNYLTGQFMEMPRITAAARAAGCVVGWDLAHAVGNVPLRLHDIEADFAVWCSYKYLNAGPGAVAGAFVHEKHADRADLPRLAGWWGNDPATRFAMHPNFTPRHGADGWQLSNPPILSLTPLKVSLDLFDRAGGMNALRRKSELLTAYLQRMIDFVLQEAGGAGSGGASGGSTPLEVITPRDPSQRGCQLSMLIRKDARAFNERLKAAGVICDFREPNIIRAAPVPMYNSFHDVWRFAMILRDHLRSA